MEKIKIKRLHEETNWIKTENKKEIKKSKRSINPSSSTEAKKRQTHRARDMAGKITPHSKKKAEWPISMQTQNRYAATTIMIQNIRHKQTDLKSSNRKVVKN